MAGVFVEIGACDFDNLDALLLDGWTGYFVEPVPVFLSSLIKKVTENTIGKEVNAVFDMCAISNYDGIGSIRYVDPESTPWWMRGIGHVSGKENNAINLNPNVNNVKLNIIENVKFSKLDSFIRRHGIEFIDIMKIDVEGHELDILKSYSWKVKPIHLKIEHTFVGVKPLLDILIPQGYDCTYDDEDIFATHQSRSSQ